jgi:hypothetical protein
MQGEARRGEGRRRGKGEGTAGIDCMVLFFVARLGARTCSVGGL